MNETPAIIERTERINNDIQHLELAPAEELGRIKPGQSLLVRLWERWDPYPRAQWWPVAVKGPKLIIERPSSEKYQPGQVVSVLGYIGQPYRFRRTLRNVLLIAHDTPPTPLLLTIPWLLGNKISVTIVLAGSARSYETGHVSPEVEVVHGDEHLVWDEQVMTVGWADQVFVVVGQDDEFARFRRVMARFEALRNDVPSNYLFGVFQPPLPCGAGACYSCMVRSRTDTSLVCTDGPAFDLTKVILT